MGANESACQARSNDTNIDHQLCTDDFADQFLLQAGLRRTGPPGQEGPPPRRPEELPSTIMSGTRTPISENSETRASRTRTETEMPEDVKFQNCWDILRRPDCRVICLFGVRLEEFDAQKPPTSQSEPDFPPYFRTVVRDPRTEKLVRADQEIRSGPLVLFEIQS